MLSSVTINCQLKKYVIYLSSELSVLKSVSQMSQVPTIAPSVKGVLLSRLTGRQVGRYESISSFFCQVMTSHHSDQMFQRLQVSRIAL